MTLKDFGYNKDIENARNLSGLKDFEIGRIISEHKERYVVITEKGELDAEITGHLRFSARSREDFPAVGDWVALTVYDAGFSIIHNILPRFSTLARKSIEMQAEKQIIATNIDYAFLVQGVDRDFNINRLERYLTLCATAAISPIIVLTKTDLADLKYITDITDSLRQRLNDVPVVAISNKTQNGYDKLKKFIKKGRTYCLLGSSGAGKSTLVNNLSEKSLMRTDVISESTHKGKHVTTHRELIVLKNGGILIDNPGMKEVGITDSSNGLESTFKKIVHFSQYCRFRNCSHTNEVGCAVIDAVQKGQLDTGSYENYLKMEREKFHFEASVAEKRKKDKDFGKMLKNFKKDIKNIR